MMLDNVFHFFLAFTHKIIIIPLIVLGYLWLDRKIFFHATCLLLISMLFNSALKVTFQIPLSPSLLKEGFAFPSGHMQAAIVLYGWLLRSTNKALIKILIILLLAGVGAGLKYFGYHNYFDILGAIIFGSFLLFTYIWFWQKFNEKMLFLFILIFSTALIFYIGLINEMQEYRWIAYYALLGIVFSEYYFIKKDLLINNATKLAATIFFLCAVFLIYIIFSFVKVPVFFSQLKWFFLGFCIPLSLRCLNFIKINREMPQHDR